MSKELWNKVPGTTPEDMKKILEWVGSDLPKTNFVKSDLAFLVPGWSPKQMDDLWKAAKELGWFEVEPTGTKWVGPKLKGKPKWTKPDSAVAAKALGWNVGGKGEAFLRTMGKAGESGLTLQEIIDKMPAPLAGTKKPDLSLAESFANQGMAKGYVMQVSPIGAVPVKYAFGYYGDAPKPAVQTPTKDPYAPSKTPAKNPDPIEPAAAKLNTVVAPAPTKTEVC
jgi:hypothetical protein